jgi:hypothetical protein
MGTAAAANDSNRISPGVLNPSFATYFFGMSAMERAGTAQADYTGSRQ